MTRGKSLLASSLLLFDLVSEDQKQIFTSNKPEKKSLKRCIAGVVENFNYHLSDKAYARFSLKIGLHFIAKYNLLLGFSIGFASLKQTLFIIGNDLKKNKRGNEVCQRRVWRHWKNVVNCKLLKH